jgi:hypothetical protein
MKHALHSFFLIIFICSAELYSQDIDDTSKIIIKRVAKTTPSMYNISEIHLKKGKENPGVYVVRVDVDVPLSTKMSLTVKDTSNDVLMYLINDQIIPMGTYRVRWEMPFCRTPGCDGYQPGRYLCEFETDQFIYVKDFFLK